MNYYSRFNNKDGYITNSYWALRCHGDAPEDLGLQSHPATINGYVLMPVEHLLPHLVDGEFKDTIANMAENAKEFYTQVKPKVI